MPDTPADVVAQHWPSTGPHSADLTTSAAEAVRGLVRYLANATRSATALPDAATAYVMLNDLADAAHTLNQVLRQTLDRTEHVDPEELRDDRGHPVDETIGIVGLALDKAIVSTLALHERLDVAAQHLAHIGRKG